MALTRDETRTFSERLEEYKEAKRRIIEKWSSNCNVLLTVEAMKDGWPENLSGLLEPAMAFLREHNVINFGVTLRSPAGTGAGSSAKIPEEPGTDSSAAARSSKEPTLREIVARLYEILRTADFSVMTEKKIRAQLEAELGCDMAPHKAFLRKHVLYVLKNQDQRETLEPLPVSDEDEDDDNKQEGRSNNKQKQVDTGKEPPHVVVVGAGLAGLMAATTLQRNGCKVIVLDAQKQPGGRLAKLFPLAGCSEASDADSTSTATAESVVAMAFGPVALRIPLAGEELNDSQESTARAAGEVWPDGAAAIRTMCSQLRVKLVSIEAAAGKDGGGVQLHRPRLYGGSPPGGDGPAGTAVGVSLVRQDVQSEAEGMLTELLAALWKRLGEQNEPGKSSVNTAAQPSSSTTTTTTSSMTSLAAELEVEIRRLMGPNANKSDNAGAAAMAAVGLQGMEAGGKELKPSSPDDTAAGRDRAEAMATAMGNGPDRPVKRRRTEKNCDTEGADAKADIAKAKDASEESGSVADQSMAIDGTAIAGRDDGAAKKAGSEDEVVHGSEDMAVDLPAAEHGRHIPKDVLYVLRNYLLPLLELQLGASLDVVSPSQLRLMPAGLLTGILSRPMLEQLPKAVPAAAQGLRLGLLPAGGARQLLEALASDLDLRTGVVVTRLTMMAAGGVKVSTDTAGTIKASAVVLAVPHAVLQSGAIAFDQPLPPYWKIVAPRVGSGGAVSMMLRLPPGVDLSSVCGRVSGDRGLRPFFVRGGASAAHGAPNSPEADTPQLSFLFCPGITFSTAMTAAASATESLPSGDKDGKEAAVVVVAHVVGTGKVKSPLELSDEDLRRQAVAALHLAAKAAAAPLPEEHLEPTSCHISRWGGFPFSAEPVAASGLSNSGGAVDRCGASAYLAVRSDPRDMTLLAAPFKGRVFFAGEHTAADQLPFGLLAGLAGSGIREATRVLKAIKSGAASGKAPSGVGLEVGNESPFQELIAAIEAEEKASAKTKAASVRPKEAAGDGSTKGEAKAKGRAMKAVASYTEAELEDDVGDAAIKRRKRDAAHASKLASRADDAKGKCAKKTKDADHAGGKGKRRKGQEEPEDMGDEEAVEDDDEEDEDLDSSSTSEPEEEEGRKKGRASGKQRKPPAGKVKHTSEDDGDDNDDEEEDVEEDEEDEEEAVRGKKAKKRKHSGRDKDDESNSDASDGDRAPKRSKGGRRSEREKERKEDSLQLGMLDKQRREQALAKLQADRKDVKVVYKAVMAATNGNLGPLREQMSSCAGLDAKLIMLQVLQKSSVQLLQLLANDGQVLAWLRDWLLELCADSSTEHLVLMELRFLERLPISADVLAAAMEKAQETGPTDAGSAGATGAMATASQTVRTLLMAVKERCGAHRGKDVKRMAAVVCTAWERRAASAVAGVGRVAAGPGSTPSGLPLTARPPTAPTFNLKNLVSLRVMHSPPVSTPGGGVAFGITTSGGTRPPGGSTVHPSRPSSAPPRPSASGSDMATGSRLTPPPAGMNGSSEAASGPSAGADTNAAPYVPARPHSNSAIEAKLLAAKAAAEAARHEAALAAQRRAEVLQEAQGAGGSRGNSLPEIDSFEDFRRIERGSSGGGAGGGGSAGNGNGKHKDGSGNSSSKYKGHRGGGSGSGGGSGNTSLEALKAAVVDHIKQTLKRHHKAGSITSSEFRVIQEKASQKVFETLSDSSAAHPNNSSDGRRDLLGTKRREKISNLVEQYVKKHAGQRLAGGSGGAGGPSLGLPPPPAPPA